MRRISLIAALAIALATPAAADDDTSKGEAQIRDALTIVLTGARFTLSDITLSAGDKCGGKDCNESAVAIIAPKLTGHEVSCVRDRRLGHGHYAGRCKLDDGTDIATIILGEGLARPQPNAAPSYMAAAEKAKSAHLGIWSAP